jgi:hypothetical protein
MRKFNGLTKFEFKKELNDIELKGIEAVLEGFRHEDGNRMAYSGAKTASEAFGLAYTSTSGYAMYHAVNMAEYNGYEISHFAITERGTLVMVCTEHGDEERSHYYGFENDDIFPEGDDE